MEAGTYGLVLSKIFLGKCFSFFTEPFLHRRVDRQLLAYGMPGEVPGEHVTPWYLVFGGGCCLELFVALVEVLVVAANGFGNSRHVG